MKTITIKVNNKDEAIGYDEEICAGFYIATKRKTVEKNIEILSIKFESLFAHPGDQHRVTKIDENSFVTTKTVNGYFQHILLSSIDKDGFFDHLNNLGDYPQLQQLLSQALMFVGKMTL